MKNLTFSSGLKCLHIIKLVCNDHNYSEMMYIEEMHANLTSKQIRLINTKGKNVEHEVNKKYFDNSLYLQYQLFQQSEFLSLLWSD